MSINNNAKISRFNGLWTVLKKEIIDNLRDRRTLTTMAVSIVITPLILIGFIWFADNKVNDETNPVTAKPYVLPVVGAEYAPNLMIWLGQNNIEVVDAPDDLELAIRSGEHRAIMVLEKSFSRLFSEGKTAPIKIIRDSSVSNFEQLGLRSVERALQAYASQIGAARLQIRGVSAEVLQPIQVNLSDVATPESRVASIVEMLPYLIIVFIMAGGMYLAIDSTAGEREKGSLESLLTLPVKRDHVLLAKLLATAFFSALTLLFILLGLAISLKYAPVDAIAFSLGVKKLAIIFIACLPFVFLGSALLILLASFTKSYKEAQSYMGFIMMVPSIPLIFLGLISPEPSISNMWVPSLSQALIIIDTIKGESIAPGLMLLSAVSSLAFAALLAFIAISFYRRERIFG